MVRLVFTWTMAVLLAAQPVAVVVWCLGQMERTDPLFLAPLWGSGAVVVLFLASRLVVRRTMARWRAEMRWLGRAAGRYLLCCLTPVLLLYVVAALRAPGGEDEYGYPLPKPEHYLDQLGFLVIWMTVPTLVLLLVQSPRAQQGRHVGGLVAVLPNMVPSFFALLGYEMALVPVVLQTVYALAVMPSIGTVGGRAGGDRNAGRRWRRPYGHLSAGVAANSPTPPPPAAAADGCVPSSNSTAPAPVPNTPRRSWRAAPGSGSSPAPTARGGSGSGADGRSRA
ncbi:hypothetical protein ACFVYP_34105 [Kitasatospora sp. NPDC058201]|uniref:hypothetical protein n=1 Tax=unclassified Kitasatospora TaxID=2633591 RepID=UPI00365BCB83